MKRLPQSVRCLLIVLFVVVGCGRETAPVALNVPSPVPVKPSPERGKVIVAVFGAPWCPACKSAIPEVQRQLKKLPDTKLAQIEFRLYVPTGANSANRPTQDVADQYKQTLGLDLATAHVDPWKWTLYQKWIGGSASIPAAAVLDDKENVLTRFRAGSQFDAQDIARFAASRVH